MFWESGRPCTGTGLCTSPGWYACSQKDLEGPLALGLSSCGSVTGGSKDVDCLT